MEKRLTQLAISVFMVIFMASLLVTLPFNDVLMVYSFLFRRQQFSVRSLQFLWNARPGSLIIACVFVVAAILLVIFLIRLLFVFIGLARDGRRQRMSYEGRTGGQKVKSAQQSAQAFERLASVARQIEKERLDVERAAQTSRSGKKAAADARKNTATLRREMQDVSHTYLTGRARYMQQLDEFLRDGVVTRSEYNELRKKYEGMDLK